MVKGDIGNVEVVNMTPTQQKELSYSTQQRESSFNTGKVKTGCPNTQELKSVPCTSQPQEIQLTDVPAQASTSTSSQHSASEEQIAIILAKKQTRQTTFYQVGIFRRSY